MSKDMLGAAVQKLVALPPERLGIAHDFLMKLSGPEAEVEACKRYLRREYPWAFPTVLRIGMSDLRIADDFLAAFKDAGIQVSDSVEGMLKQQEFVVAEQEAELELFVRSIEELGLSPWGAVLADIYKRAAELGFELCPPEVGPRVRLMYKNQPKEMLLVAMEPISNSEGEPCVWDITVGMDGRPCFYGRHCIDKEHVFFSSQRFIFCRRKSAKRRGR